jgi:hypothetical protein
VGPCVSLDEPESREILSLPGLELRPLGRPARSQSLYRLRYLGYPLKYTALHIKLMLDYEAVFLWNGDKLKM